MTDDQIEQGRPEPPLTGNETDTLLGFLAYQRATFAWKCAGLSDDQLRAKLHHPTVMTLGGLLMHLARVEDNWFSLHLLEAPNPEPWASMPWAAEWETSASLTGDELRQLWRDRVEASNAVAQSQLTVGPSALDVTHPTRGRDRHVSLRWVLVHMIEEYARHNGHADLLREAIDGHTGE